MTLWPYPRWWAHRGAGKLAPENTLAAFRHGAALGWRAFECDVKLSADEVPFLLHDATLERTTPEAGVAGLRPWSELSRMDAGAWAGRLWAGEPIPSLQALARWVLANGLQLNIEIKPTPGQEARTGEVVAHEVLRLWPAGALPPLLSSFSPQALQAAQAVAPALPRALLLDTLWPGGLEAAAQLGCVAVTTHYNLMDAALVQRLHAEGRRALVYTVNEPADAQALLAAGVDGLITDEVARFSPAAA